MINYGFERNKDKFIYSCELIEGEFRLDIEIKPPNFIKTKAIEIDTNEIYILHLTDAEGDFVGKIREKYKNKITDIAEKCFERDVFKSDYAIKIIEYIREKYNNEIEFLWENFPRTAVARRLDNKKWYFAILNVQKNKLGINSNELVEIIDIRADKEKVPELIKKENIYPGYHMNKKNWITIILDGKIEISEIFDKIDESYILASKK